MRTDSNIELASRPGIQAVDFLEQIPSIDRRAYWHGPLPVEANPRRF
jgi:hypothetical protein